MVGQPILTLDVPSDDASGGGPLVDPSLDSPPPDAQAAVVEETKRSREPVKTDA